MAIATVSTALKMFDQMTRPLQQVTQALNLTITAMDNMNNAANKDIGITNTLNTARTAIQNANAGLNQLANSQDKVTNAQNRLNNSFNNGSKVTGGLIGKVKGLLGAYLGFQSVKKGLELTTGGAFGQQKWLDMFIARTGDIRIGTAMFDKFKADALKAGQDVNKSLQGTLSFFSATQNTDQLTKLNNLTQRLSAFDSAGNGIEGAAFSLKEALSGDIVSLAERFNMSKADIRAFKIDKLGKTGNIDGFLTAFDQLLEKQKMGQEAFDTMMKSPIKQMETLGNNVKSAFANSGESAAMAFLPVITRLNDAFSDGSFQNFFNGISAGLSIIVTLALGVADVFQWIGNVVGNNWGIIEPIIWGIVAALIAYNVVAFITNGIIARGAFLESVKAVKTSIAAGATFAQTAAQHGLNAALYACPITWIILGIIALIVLFYAAVGAVNKFAGTSLSATGLICGAFMVAGAFIWNTVIGVINATIQAVWTMFVEPFIGIIEWVLNAANGGFDSFGGAVANLIGQIISWFLSLGKVVTKIIDAIFGTNWTAGLSSLQDSVLAWGKNDNAITLDRAAPEIGARLEYGNAWDTGYKFGADLENKFNLDNLFNKGKIPEVPKMPDLDAWNAAQGPGVLSMGGLDKGSKDHLKNIDDKIDISNEHLEMMRDLAEQESIQNFVTLTPSVNIQTGDIKEEADIDKIITKIETYMEEELVNSAEGVYA